jgi:hypothetical protein
MAFKVFMANKIAISCASHVTRRNFRERRAMVTAMARS